MVNGDYTGAVGKYRQAIDLEPGSVPLRFALGAAYSFLDKRPEAIAQFRWVLGQASSTSREYREARAWLARVGALVELAGPDDGSQAETASFDNGIPKGRIFGKTEWPGVEPRSHFISGNLSLIGDEPVTHDEKRTRPFRLGDLYEFRDLPPGRYRLVAVVDETTLWDEKVTVEPGKQTDFVLSHASSPVPVEKFAPPPAKPEPEPQQ